MAVINGKKIKEENSGTFFSYRAGNTFMHKIHPVAKVLLMILLALGAFWVPPLPALIAWVALILFSFLVLKFSPKEILTDISPALAYCFFFYSVSVLLNVIEKNTPVYIPNSQYIATLSHLALSLEVSSVFYRTTTSSQFAQGFRSIEHALTKKEETPFADNLSLTMIFLPRLASFWKRISSAWKARSGKSNTRRIRILVPVLFRVSMHEAYTKALAMENRS